MKSPIVLGTVIIFAVLVVAYAVATVQKSSTPAPRASQENQSLNKVHLLGRVMQESDVETIPDSPYSKGWVVAISSQELAAVLHRAGISPGEKRRLRFRMNEDLFSAYAVESTRVEIGGSYSLYLDGGGYVLCIGKGEASNEGDRT